MDAPRGIVVEETASEVEEAREPIAVEKQKEVGKPETEAKSGVKRAKDEKHARSGRRAEILRTRTWRRASLTCS
jgi:hypothetical protein